MENTDAQLEAISESTANSVSLLISILVRYPEIATVNFDPEGKILKFTFMTSSPVSSEKWNDFCYKLNESVEVYSSLVHRGVPQVLSLIHIYSVSGVIHIT